MTFVNWHRIITPTLFLTKRPLKWIFSLKKSFEMYKYFAKVTSKKSYTRKETNDTIDTALKQSKQKLTDLTTLEGIKNYAR